MDKKKLAFSFVCNTSHQAAMNTFPEFYSIFHLKSDFLDFPLSPDITHTVTTIPCVLDLDGLAAD